MKIQIAYCAIVASLLIGCKKELQPQESTVDSTTVAVTPSSPQAAAPGTPQAQMQATPPPVQSQVHATPQSAKVAPGMNPAHGQPGHRCDIAVGAPLSSAPAKPASQMPQTITPAPTQVSQPQATTQPPAILNAPAQATAPGMNPPHGQPGHRCDVSVGAPLPKA